MASWRHARFPGASGQAEAAWKFGVPRIELEHVGGAVIAVDEAHLVGDLGIVVPELDRADMRLVVAAEQHHDGLQEFSRKHRHRHAAGQSGLDGLIGPFEIGVGEFGEDHGVPAGPSLARKALVISEAQIFAHGLERGQPFAVEAATEFQPHARRVRHPEFNDANEGLHRTGPPPQTATASAIWLRNGRSKFRQDSANFVRWGAAAS